MKRLFGLAGLLLCALLAGCQPAPRAPLAAQATPTIAPGSPAARTETLRSLKQLDDYPLYEMHYLAGYPLTASPAPPAVSMPLASRPAWGCSLFAALGDPASQVFGRNFDWEYSPALLLFTAPPEGYASISMVDISYLGYAGELAKGLAGQPPEKLQGLLGAPGLPFDGMNDQGLVVGMAAVPASAKPQDPHKPTLDSLAVIREMLDHAATVDEAVKILGNTNIEWGGGPPLHYLLADAAGHAALVEFYQGQMIVTPNQQPWHLATNFIVGAVPQATAGQCWRYDRIERQLQADQGKLTPSAALELLSQVAQDTTQWSVVYDIQRRQVRVVMGKTFDKVHTLRLAGP